MKLFRNKEELLKEIKTIKNINFVPTMGSLHKGHESLIKKSVKNSKNAIVSIFINPKQFENIYGVRPLLAKKLWNNGYHSIHELRESHGKNGLKESSQLYLEYYEDLQKDIPRDYIFIFELVLRIFITRGFGSNYRLVTAGSYSRGAAESGDIDVLVYSPDFTLDDLASYLMYNGIVLSVLALGKEKMHAIAHCPGNLWHPFRLDIHFVTNPDNWAAATLYFTSGVYFNQFIRAVAKKQNLTLSDKGLQRPTGEIINTPTEETIFDVLGISFVPTSARD